MAVFYYQGKTEAGAATSGAIEAPSRMLATVKLRQQGIWIEALTDKPAPAPGETAESPQHPPVWSPFYGLLPVSAGAMGNLFDQIGSMYRAGITPHTLATELSERVSNGRLRTILQKAAPRLAAGEPLGACMATYPQVFPSGVGGMVRAA